MKRTLPKIVVILGPTASGKSSWGLSLAKQFDGYIISADSRQIYCGMDIGTNKDITPNIPHYMIDIVNPNEDYSVAQYQREVKRIIKTNQPQVPFLVGGTGLYIKTIINNLTIPEVKADLELRQKLERQTNEQLLTQLQKLDPTCAKKIDANNQRRLVRALEVCLITGQPFSQYQRKGQPLFEVLQIGISVPQKELEQRIDLRVEQMIKQGLVSEVELLLSEYHQMPIPDVPPKGDIGYRWRRADDGNAQPASRRGRNSCATAKAIGDTRSASTITSQPQNNIAFSGIGYQEIIQYLQAKISLDQAIALIKLHTRQYAKRQMTWFKKDPRIYWVIEYQKAEKLTQIFLKN